MNNDHYRTTKQDPEAMRDPKDHTEKVALALDHLVKNRDWKIVCEEILQKRLDGAREIADQSEGPKLFRFQGEIKVLKFLLNLQTALDAQKQTIEHHGKTEEDTELPAEIIRRTGARGSGSSS